jgi:hypothetical protein
MSCLPYNSPCGDLPYTALRDPIITQPMIVEGLNALFWSAPKNSDVSEEEQPKNSDSKRGAISHEARSSHEGRRPQTIR